MTRFLRPHPDLTLGILYTLLLVSGAALINSLTWTPGPSSTLDWTMAVLWIALYLPVPLYLLLAGWQLAGDFGFALTPKTLVLLVLAITVALGASQIQASRPGVVSALLEAFARTGEELFFRGFVYGLCLRLFAGRKRPWLWAVLLSSLAFTLPHTQVFLPGNSSNLSSVFVSAVVFALLRAWSGSILFSAILHSTLNGGILGGALSLAIYGLFVLLAAARKEKLVVGFNP